MDSIKNATCTPWHSCTALRVKRKIPPQSTKQPRCWSNCFHWNCWQNPSWGKTEHGHDNSKLRMNFYEHCSTAAEKNHDMLYACLSMIVKMQSFEDFLFWIPSFSHKRKTSSAKQKEDFEKFTLTSGCLTSCSSVRLASWNRWFWAIMKQFWQYPSSIVLPRVPQSRRWQDTVLRKPAAELPVWSAAEDFLWDLLWWRSKTLSVMQSMERSSLNVPNRSDDPKQL